MSSSLIQDLHAAISRRDWTTTEIVANSLRYDIEAARKALAGTQIGSLPNDYPLRKLASDVVSSRAYPDVQRVIGEMIAVAAGEYEGYEETLDPWTADNRADIDRWQRDITASLSTPHTPTGE